MKVTATIACEYCGTAEGDAHRENCTHPKFRPGGITRVTGYAIEQRDRIDAAFKEAWADLCPDIDPDHAPRWQGTVIILHRLIKRIERARATP